MFRLTLTSRETCIEKVVWSKKGNVFKGWAEILMIAVQALEKRTAELKQKESRFHAHSPA